MSRINIILSDGTHLEGTPIEVVEQWKDQDWAAEGLSVNDFVSGKAKVFGIIVEGKTEVEKCQSFLDAMVAGGFAQKETQ